MLTWVYLSALLIFSLFDAALGQDVGQWIIPNSAKPNFTDVYNNGNSITWSWQGMNRSMSDLWLTSYDPTLSYALRVAANINITEPGTLPWTITVNDTLIDIDDRFSLRFVLTGTDIYPLHADQFPSPAFLILHSGQTLPATTDGPSTSSSTVASSASPTTQTMTPTSSSASVPSSSTGPPPPSHPTLSAGAKAGIAIGVTAVFLIILALLFWVMRLYRRVKAASNQHSRGIIPEDSEEASPTTPGTVPAIKQISGLHEVIGDRRHPTELSVKQEKDVLCELPG